MFTGIIEETGEIVSIKKDVHSIKLYIHAKKILEDLKIGDSVSVNGICLTVTNLNDKEFTADVMHETLNKTSLSTIKKGNKVNLERAMLATDRFGGHFVYGHIDGTGIITKIEKDDIAIWYKIKTEPDVMKYIIEKGSVAIDGISLTVAKISNDGFSISAIPHTLGSTTLLYKSVNDIVNIENDCIGKYIEKLLFTDKENSSKITKEFLFKNGYV